MTSPAESTRTSPAARRPGAARQPTARGMARVAAVATVLAALACSTTPPALPPGVDAPAAERLRETVERLADRLWNPGRLAAAKERAFELGLGPLGRSERIDWFTVQRNHVITIPGRSEGIAYVVAHYDKTDANPLKLASLLVNGAIDELVGWTYASQGAWDNATGVALALELARALHSTVPRLTWRILLTGAEESGLRGARAHVARLSDTEWRRVRFAINLDTLAADDRPDCVINDASDPELAVQALDAARAEGVELALGRMPAGAAGDQAPFARTGFWHDFGRGLMFNLAGGLLPQRSWFTGSHGTRVLTFSSCDSIDWTDLVAGSFFLPVGRLHGPRDRASRVDPVRLHEDLRMLRRLVAVLDAEP